MATKLFYRMKHGGHQADYPVSDPDEAVEQIRTRKRIDEAVGWDCTYELWMQNIKGKLSQLPLPEDCY